MLVSFHANLHSDDISCDAAVCTYMLSLPDVFQSRKSSVVRRLASDPGEPGLIPGVDNFFLGGGGGWELFFFFLIFISMMVKLLTPHPYDISSRQITTAVRSGYF